MTFSVWAPFAKSVALCLGEQRVAMQRDSTGTWRTDVPNAQPGVAYRYSIDDGVALPDPRSRWQPDGVHGDSRMIDVDRLRQVHTIGFKPQPLHETVIYEMHVGTFTAEGTYSSARSKLPHLVDLGITHIEMMPLATFPGKHGWGYDGVDLYAPFPAYGTPQELASFVEACHAHGLAVLLDVVYNHFGPDGNYLSLYGPYFTAQWKTAWGDAINYDGPHSDDVRRFIIENALMWLRDYGFDGLRLDAVHAIFSFGAIHVLEELAVAVKELGTETGRTFALIAESDLNDPRLVRPSSRGGYGLDAHWSDDFHHALHRFFTGENNGYYADFNGLEDIAIALREGYIFQGQYSPHRQHRHGRPPAGLAPHQLVVCSQNHDQIGNRAFGERLSMMLTWPQLKAIAALTLLSPFVPLLFQGEEWGAHTPFLYFTDHEDHELGKRVAEGRRKEFGSFGWKEEVSNPQQRETFERSKLDWSELSKAEHADLLAWYQQLIRIRRKKQLILKSGTAKVKFDETARWLTYFHSGVLAVFNFSSHPQRIPMPAGEWQLVLSSIGAEDGGMDQLPASATRIFERGKGV